MVLRILLCCCVVHVGLGGGAEVRTVPFRDVLHGVAYKMGLDPDQSNFLTNQAIPIGTYIDEWVRRTYDARDWPEWVVTRRFIVSNHVVPWDIIVSGVTYKIGRVLKVYLVDPATTDAPVDTPFTLHEDGIHVGYQHGTYVWVRFMVPPPQYTAVQWRSDTVFAKDDVTYSYTTGQVYKSKSNGNLGHNPASTFSVPPVPNVIEPHPPSPAPDVTTTQAWIPTNSGLAPRDKILKFYIADATPNNPTDPPDVGSAWNIVVIDASGTPVGSAGHTTIGAETLSDVLDDIYTQLVASLTGFTVTKDTPNLAIQLEDNSNFSFNRPNGWCYWVGGDGVVENNLRIDEIQSYVPLFSAASGQPQITRVSMSDASTIPGSTYYLNVTDSSGEVHTVSYASQLYDSAAQILQGLLFATEAAQVTDTFWPTVQFTFDPSAATLDLSVGATFSVDAPAPPPGSAWWELVPFPRALADQVMTGALGDLLMEWGSADKAAMQEQKVPAETEISANDFTTTPNPPLTTQQRPLSRYQLQP